MKPLNALDNINKTILAHILFVLIFKHLLPPIVVRIEIMPPYISESQHEYLLHFYLTFFDGFVQILILLLFVLTISAIVANIQRSFSFPISEHINIHALRHA